MENNPFRLLTVKQEIFENNEDEANNSNADNSSDHNSLYSLDSGHPNDTTTSLPDGIHGNRDELQKLEQELILANQKLAEKNDQLKVAQDTISKQKDQLMNAAKFVMEHQKHVASAEENGRAANELKRQMLEQVLSELESEKKLRLKAEGTVSKLQYSLKAMVNELSQVIGALWDESKEEEVVSIQRDDHVLQKHFITVSSKIHMRLDEFFRTQTERFLEAYENRIMMENLMRFLQRRQKANAILANHTTPTALSSPIMPPSSAVSTPMTLRKRKPTDPIKSQTPRNKVSLNRSQRNEPSKLIGSINFISKIIESETPVPASIQTDEETLPPTNDNPSHSSLTSIHGMDLSDPSKPSCLCGYKSKLIDSVRMHIKRHNTIPQFRCNKCDQSFVFGGELKIHYKNVHKFIWSLDYGCRLCGQNCPSRMALTLHQKAAHFSKSGRLPGKIQGQVPIISTSLPPNAMGPAPAGSPEEKKQHGRDRNAPRHNYHCLCGKKYNLVSSFYQHIRLNTKPYKFKCSLCPKSFNAHRDLKQHVINVHKTKYLNKMYGCGDCGETFSTMDQLLVHRKKFHSKFSANSNPSTKEMAVRSDQVSPLETASSPSTSKKALNHGVDPSNSTQSLCICGKIYMNRSKLRQHIAYMSGELQFHCSKCTKSFVFGSLLKQHYKKKHNISWKLSTARPLNSQESVPTSKTDAKPTSYSLELPSFNSPSLQPTFSKETETTPSGSATANKQHGINPLDPKSLRCICGVKYRTKDSLNYHLRICNDEPKFRCKECPSSFLFGSHLKSHYRNAHHIVWEYSQYTGCTRCGEAFSNQKELRAHKMAFHP